MNRIPNQAFVDKIAAGLNMANAVDTSKSGGVNEPIENQVKPELWLESDSTVTESTIRAAASGHDWIPVEELLSSRDGILMTELSQYFKVNVKVAKEI